MQSGRGQEAGVKKAYTVSFLNLFQLDSYFSHDLLSCAQSQVTYDLARLLQPLKCSQFAQAIIKHPYD
ncbi:hypothetical protein OGM63_10615 [Plectonema radiosum NIES-515]|uniref:Uncharacterized protein n=1 Tax=Plectonema radiosum NIES-515 TaxID=2986073 RepID=A0ABT3AXV7_9CYAN|nr:hypothetical protein [Plectonema radiosum]MCV3213961.1 hypothetical protein [Plectonema radiosum NIES-515]